MATDNKSFSDNFKRRIYEFILRVIKFVETLPKSDDLCRIAKDQILRSATSIGANYVEAIAGSSKKDFTNFLSHSLKSANETKFWLALLRDTGKGNDNEIGGLLRELIEISNILGSSVKTLRGK
ncbi:four helix bundle protein [Patescibacteria group bacterium]|nr:four helix bundle protein [Patescibacteria group bacterium]MBU2220193.1 four helix bundle protein [Patescibacteria group bacterium]MBU2264674.1 four helix bundle protein [Patescibacteria group bacterium]